MFNDLISIILPIYNEEKSIKATVAEIKNTCEQNGINYEIIAVNDCSKDNSAAILETIPNIRLIHHKINQGYGAALKTGVKCAKGDWILITDVDGTYPNKDIPRLISELPNYDMVVGSRTGATVKIPFFRKPAKAFLNKFASYLSGHKVIDLNSGLRVFRKTIVEKYWSLFPDRFSFTSTLTMVCFTRGYLVKYLPIDYFKREGKSSIKPRNFIDFLNLVIKLSLFFKPIKVFGPISLVILLGAIFLIIAFFTGLTAKFLDTTFIVLCATSLQTFFFGLIAEIVIHNK